MWVFSVAASTAADAGDLSGLSECALVIATTRSARASSEAGHGTYMLSEKSVSSLQDTLETVYVQDMRRSSA